MNCVILDDEPLAIRLLKDYVEKTEGLEILLGTTDPFQVIDTVKAGKADLLFLDIQMPELSGLQIMKILENDVAIIVTSAYEQYAIKGFEHNVKDYLLKPVSYERFLRAIEKVSPLKSERTIEPFSEPKHIFVKSEYKLIRLDLDEILRFESDRDYITIFTEKEKILTLQSLSEWEQTLPASKFSRIHRSHIINLEKIESIENNRVVIKGIYLPIGETFKADFYKKIGHQA
ncbi:MAG: LytTR family DNA-binding domain-containing protein [Saprospiraceae bacterium]